MLKPRSDYDRGFIAGAIAVVVLDVAMALAQAFLKGLGVL